MRIRNMTESDYDRAYHLWLDTPGLGLNPVDDSREGIAKYVRRNPDTCFVAEENGELLGVILCGHDGRRGYLYHAAVHAAHRHKGIGRALVDHALRALAREGINKAALVAFADNISGNTFWEAQGFIKRDDLCYRNKFTR